MGRKFTVIKTTDSENEAEYKRVFKITKLSERWERQYFDAVVKSCTGRSGNIQDLPQDELAKIGFAGIKYICANRDVERENKRLGLTVEKKALSNSQVKFQMIDGLFTILGCLTLRNFVNTFPITKRYDGHRYDCKDYFFTMDVLSEMDWDKPIGKDNVPDLLWDYLNEDLGDVNVEFMCAMSDLYRMQTGKSIAEKFCEDNGIGTYTINDETGIIKDNQTGHTMKLKKRSNLQIVK